MDTWVVDLYLEYTGLSTDNWYPPGDLSISDGFDRQNAREITRLTLANDNFFGADDRG